jgi:hypothetical protein
LSRQQYELDELLMLYVFSKVCIESPEIFTMLYSLPWRVGLRGLLCSQATLECKGCGSDCGVLTASSGYLSDGSGSSGYSNNANCEWTIAPPDAKRITLYFSEFCTQPHKDFLRVFDCTDVSCSQQQQLAELSGTSVASKTIMSTTGFMKVVFTSDESVNCRGFTAMWNMVSFLVHEGSEHEKIMLSILIGYAYSQVLMCCRCLQQLQMPPRFGKKDQDISGADFACLFC